MTNPVHNSPDALSTEETIRYSRHLSLPEVGSEGQMRLKRASVLLIGAGGLGSPLALYLAAAGIGRIGLVDFDKVDLSNLQRQILHGTADVGRPKLASARESIEAINPHVQVDGYETRLNSGNALEILKPYDIVIDGTDNFPTRYLVNDACIFLKKPLVYGSIFRFEGQASVFHAGHGPCYRCLYPEPPPPGLVPDCAEGGVLGVLPGIIGTIQATEAIKLILGRGESLLGRLLLYDALRMKFRELKISRDLNCPVCGEHPLITKLMDYETFCGVRPTAATRGTQPMNDPNRISARALKAELDGGAKILLLDVREPHEFNIAHLPDSQLVPAGMLDMQLDEFDRNANIVAYCRSGVRSQRAAKLLRDRGFTHVRDLEGGILAWADQVDPTMPKY